MNITENNLTDTQKASLKRHMLGVISDYYGSDSAVYERFYLGHESSIEKEFKLISKVTSTKSYFGG